MIRRLVQKLKKMYYNSSNELRIRYLINEGAKIGEGTRLNCNIDSFGSEPYLVSIGKNCLFAGDINFITHDGGIKVLNSLNYFNGARMDNIAPIKIGDNVYIGFGACIMPGVTIGDNVIIGAGAIVTRDINDNSVAVGIPAKVIKTIDEYYINVVERDRLFPTATLTRKEKREYFENLNIFKE